MRRFTVLIKPLTPIWTGDANRRNTTLRETGIIGSLRWWYEALLRGLGGTACDPSDTKCNAEKHCDACELFGCTGWARKFRLDIEKRRDNTVLQLIELREMGDTELALLNETIKIIADYGSLGGRIAEPNGLIEIERNDLEDYTVNKAQVREYLRGRGSCTDNPNVARFIFINKNVKYPVVKELKDELSFLKGQTNKAKRYFYKTYQKKPFRFFAYGENHEEYEKIKYFLKLKKTQFVEGIELLEGLR